MRGFMKRCKKKMVGSQRNLEILLEALSLGMRGFIIKRCDKEMVGSRRGPGSKKSTPGGGEPGNERFHKEMW